MNFLEAIVTEMVMTVVFGYAGTMNSRLVSFAIRHVWQIRRNRIKAKRDRSDITPIQRKLACFALSFLSPAKVVHYN